MRLTGNNSGEATTQLSNIFVEATRQTGTVRDPRRKKLVDARRAIVDGWMHAADILDRQGEISLAGDVRYFAKHLPPVLTDRERIAAGILSQVDRLRAASPTDKVRVANFDMTR